MVASRRVVGKAWRGLRNIGAARVDGRAQDCNLANGDGGMGESGNQIKSHWYLSHAKQGLVSKGPRPPRNIANQIPLA